MLLAADIGATKTVLALYSPEGGPHAGLNEREVLTSDYPDLETLVSEFIQETGAAVESASLGIAAPIKDGRAVMINLPWVIEEGRLKEVLKLRVVRFLNDLEALANAVPLLHSRDLLTLNEGIPHPGSPVAVIAPGTGLGEAFLIWDGTGYRSYPSEGGHADFAPSNDLEIDLLRYLLTKFDHVSYERVCSGPGLYNIYSFLKASGRYEEPAWLAEELAAVEDPTPVIVAAGKGKPCPICETTLDIFASVLGAEAGNLALKLLAANGVYVAGGIPPRIPDILKDGNFMRQFTNKGRESFIVKDIPVHIVLNNRAGLIGAAAYGLDHLT